MTDPVIPELLKQIYYDPKTGLQGSKLYQKAKAIDPKITLNNPHHRYSNEEQLNIIIH